MEDGQRGQWKDKVEDKEACGAGKRRHQNKQTNHSLLAAYLFSFRVLLDILRQLSHTKLAVEEAERKTHEQ